MGLPILGFAPNVEELDDLLGMPCGIAHEAGDDSVERLADGILRLAGPASEFSPARRAQLQERARELFSLERFERQYLELYAALQAGTGGRAA